MIHIEKSNFRRGEYTALAGTAATLQRYRIFRDIVGLAGRRMGWRAIGDNGSHETAGTLAELDRRFVAMSPVLYDLETLDGVLAASQVHGVCFNTLHLAKSRKR